MRALDEETALRVPVPLRTESGAEVAVVEVDDRRHLVVAASWLDGDEVGECDEVQAWALGQAMATMHAHARTWALPEGGHLSAFTDPYFGDEDRLLDAFADRPEERALVVWAVERCQEAMTAAERSAHPIVIHGDLHGGNLLWDEGALAVLDFDDCGIAVPALDLAIATFSLRGGAPRIEAALREGHTQTGELPAEARDDGFEGLVAARQLLLANDLLRSRTVELRKMALPYLDRTADRLRRWRRSGRFTLSPR